ncbi:hypothetical protein WJX72_008430 [[Myrmecia] bisecta]|uniref:3-oxoacyl-[acyl-carrier-protein] reductase n=1 Tax=[Myrmecia] bisecta TaxID=41462 RepID=A0AAW1PPW6_9CHLO
MDLGLEGKLVVVTGSTSGIGLAIAQKFAAVGAHVVVNGRGDDNVKGAIQKIQANRPEAKLTGIAGDVGTAEGAEAFCTAVDALGQPLHVLINNVGIFGVKDFWDITNDDWQHTFDVNLFSNVRLCRHFLKQMLERNQGRIIMVASEAGVRIVSSMIHYSVSKTAQIGLAQGLAQLTKGTKVTVNSVLVGPTWTEGVDKYIGGIAAQTGRTHEEEMKAYFAEREPSSLLQRFLTVEEVAAPIVFLASDAAAGINGSAQRVEGGIIRHI